MLDRHMTGTSHWDGISRDYYTCASRDGTHPFNRGVPVPPAYPSADDHERWQVPQAMVEVAAVPLNR